MVVSLSVAQTNKNIEKIINDRVEKRVGKFDAVYDLFWDAENLSPANGKVIDALKALKERVAVCVSKYLEKDVKDVKVIQRNATSTVTLKYAAANEFFMKNMVYMYIYIYKIIIIIINFSLS